MAYAPSGNQIACHPLLQGAAAFEAQRHAYFSPLCQSQHLARSFTRSMKPRPESQILRLLNRSLHSSSLKSRPSKLAIVGPWHATQGMVATLRQPPSRREPDGCLPARPIEITCRSLSLAVSSPGTISACVHATPPGSVCKVAKGHGTRAPQPQDFDCGAQVWRACFFGPAPG